MTDDSMQVKLTTLMNNEQSTDNSILGWREESFDFRDLNDTSKKLEKSGTRVK